MSVHQATEVLDAVAPYPLTTLAYENADGSDLRTNHHAPQARMVRAAFAALAHLEQLLHL